MISFHVRLLCELFAETSSFNIILKLAWRGQREFLSGNWVTRVLRTRSSELELKQGDNLCEAEEKKVSQIKQ